MKNIGFFLFPYKSLDTQCERSHDTIESWMKIQPWNDQIEYISGLPRKHTHAWPLISSITRSKSSECVRMCRRWLFLKLYIFSCITRFRLCRTVYELSGVVYQSFNERMLWKVIGGQSCYSRIWDGSGGLERLIQILSHSADQRRKYVMHRSIQSILYNIQYRIGSNIRGIFYWEAVKSSYIWISNNRKFECRAFAFALICWLPNRY